MSIIHKTAKGKEVDMNKLATQNELTVAVSNVRINARGDELGPGGQIIRKYDSDAVAAGVPAQQQAVREAAPKPAPVVSKPVSKPVMSPVFESPNALLQPAPAVKELDKQSKGKQ